MESSSREECKLNAVSLDHLGSELHALEHRRNYETLKTAYEQLKVMTFVVEMFLSCATFATTRER